MTVDGRFPDVLYLAPKKQNYIAQLGASITRQHACGAVYHATVAVHEVVAGKTLWKGDVEVFHLINHPEAKRAYAWAAHPRRVKTNKSRYVTVLELPPINSPETAVRASMSSLSE